MAMSKMQRQVFWIVIMLSLEREVEAGEETVAALIGAAVRCFDHVECRELYVPGEAGTAIDERIETITRSENIDVAEIDWKTAQRLARIAHQFVGSDNQRHER